MPELIDAYDLYNDFERYAFFTICFDSLPSNLTFTTQMVNTKENMEAVKGSIGFEAFDLKPVFKNWRTKDIKNTNISEDYPFECLYKSESRKLLVWISLIYGRVQVDFIYDLADSELEKWVLDVNHILRTKFGELKKSSFKVLSRNEKHFYTEDISTGDFKATDISTVYNDDFQEIHSIIVKSMTDSQSGLILLHGEPGTGKTSYIKNLVCSFEDKSFFFVQNEFVRELLKPDFISFLLRHRNSVLIIEDAEKVITSREYSNEESVVSTILQLTDGLFSDYLNIKIICTFNSSMEKVDRALFRKGRMIANYEFKPLSKEKAAKLSTSLGFGAVEEEMTLADIFRLKDKAFKQAEVRKIGF